MKNLEQRFNEIFDKALEGYKVMPPMDKDKYPEMPGLEGPFTLMSGKVVYYDPKEGAYYDKDTDMYMSYDEFQQHDNDYSNMKDERDDVKEVDKSAIDAAVAQAMSGAPQSSPRPKARPKRIPRPKARPTINIGSNPETGATRGIDPRDNYSPEDLKRLLMQSAMSEMEEAMDGEITKDSVKKSALELLVDIAKTSKQYKGEVTDDQVHYLGSLVHDFDMAGIETEKYSEIEKLFRTMANTERADMSMIQPAYAQAKNLDEGFSPKEIKMAIGVASDKRYAGGNMTGAIKAIDKIKRGLSNHPQVSAVLRRQNEDVAVRRDGKTLSKGEKAKLQRQGVLMKEGARGLDSIDWPDSNMLQTATDAIRHGYTTNDAFSHLYSMHGDDHGKWLRANEDDILAMFSQYSMDESISEGEEKPYICVHAKKGKHECRAETSYAAAKKAAEHWGLKSTSGIDAHLAIDEGDGRKKGIHGKGHPMRKAQQAAIHANEGKMSDSIIDDSETMSKEEFTKKHGKEMADQYFESKLQDMRKALKLSESTDANTVVAQYTRATLDQTHNTWNKVCEQIDHIRSFVKEDVDVNNVRLQIRKMHEQEGLDHKIQIKENVGKLRQIVKGKSAMSIKFADGSMKVDMTTASIFLQVFDKVKEETQAKIVDKIQTKAGFLSMLELMYKKIG